MEFHMDPQDPSPNPMKALWILLSTQILPVSELWPPSCCSQPHLAPKSPKVSTERALKRSPGRENKYKPSAKMAASSATRITTCETFVSKKPSLVSSCRNCLKASRSSCSFLFAKSLPP